MDWRDKGILLNVRSHGENATIIQVLTAEHGRYTGVVRGGSSRKLTPALQPGAQLALNWRARLEDHMGVFKVELIRSRTAMIMCDRQALEGLNTVTSMLLTFLPEREAYTVLFGATEFLLDLINDQIVWPSAYLKWELALLDVLGFGLDLVSCAVTGKKEDLVYISPRTGRAVSREGAGEWASRLFPLPSILRGKQTVEYALVKKGLDITGFFFKNHVVKGLGIKSLPPARSRFVDRLGNLT